MNLDTLLKGNELKQKIDALTGKLSALRSAPHGAIDLNIMGVKSGRTCSEYIGNINLTSDFIDPEINLLMQSEFKIFKDKLTEIISAELLDKQIEFDNLK